MKYKPIITFFICLTAAGCSFISETSKTFWGSSTRALDQARASGFTITYRCSFDECFNAVLSLARNEEEYEPFTSNKYFEIFLKDRIKGVIVVMGIPRQVDTTEAGIFFKELGDNKIKIDVSSLSSTAKEKVAKAVFAELEARFNAGKDGDTSENNI